VNVSAIGQSSVTSDLPSRSRPEAGMSVVPSQSDESSGVTNRLSSYYTAKPVKASLPAVLT